MIESNVIVTQTKDSLCYGMQRGQFYELLLPKIALAKISASLKRVYPSTQLLLP